jgi:hypothetical protein
MRCSPRLRPSMAAARCETVVVVDFVDDQNAVG